MKFCTAIIVTGFLLSAPGCAKYYKFQSRIAAKSMREQCIHIDKDYDYFIRQLYRSSSSGKNEQKNFSETAATDSLLEIEYLFVSKKDKKVIYISTLPDKFQQYYADPARYLGENFVNVYDFKKISFGVLKTENDFEFTSRDGKDKDVWNVIMQNKAGFHYLTINTVEQIRNKEFVDLIPVNRALENDISFKKIEQPYTILFYRNDKLKDSAVCTDQNVCINKYGDKYEVFFHFDREISTGGRVVYFYNKRIPYSPDAALK